MLPLFLDKQKAKRPKPKRPRPVSGAKSVATSSEEEEVVYECGRDYEEVDSGGTGLVIRKGAEIKVLGKV